MLRPDFNDKDYKESFYDLREDWALIESSLAKQYGIRIRQQKDMPWSEFSALLSGLMSDTPLGQIVAIRSEKDRKAIKAFTADQRRIYNHWRTRNAEKALQNPDKLNKQWDDLSKMLENLFGKEGGDKR